MEIFKCHLTFHPHLLQISCKSPMSLKPIVLNFYVSFTTNNNHCSSLHHLSFFTLFCFSALTAGWRQVSYPRFWAGFWLMERVKSFVSSIIFTVLLSGILQDPCIPPDEENHSIIHITISVLAGDYLRNAYSNMWMNSTANWNRERIWLTDWGRTSGLLVKINGLPRRLWVSTAHPAYQTLLIRFNKLNRDTLLTPFDGSWKNPFMIC